MDVLGRILISLGILSLLHAGFSTIQYKTYLKLTEDDFQYLPIDVSLLLAVLFLIFQIVYIIIECFVCDKNKDARIPYLQINHILVCNQ